MVIISVTLEAKSKSIRPYLKHKLKQKGLEV
jgi:hypothetical protein